MPFRKTGAKIVFSAIGVLSAILGNIVYFVLLARQWIPEEFGYYLYIYSLATLLTLVIDYGFPQRVLREVPLFSFRNKINLIKGVSAKVAATLMVMVFALLFVYFYENKELFVIVIAATAIGSFGDYFSSHMKAMHHHKIDSANLLITNAILILAVFILMDLLGRALTLNEAALLLLTSKSYYLVSSAYFASKILRLPILSAKIRLFAVESEMKKGAPYAMDVTLIRSYGVVDTILLRYFAGDAATGIYQSGQRLLQGFLPLAQVFNNVFLPLLSRSYDTNRFKKQAIILLSLSGITGVLGLMVFHYAGSYIVNLVFGIKYIEVLPYLSAFGMVIFLRFISSGIAILLTATGNQRKRTTLNALSLVLLIVLMIILGKSQGTWGIIYSIFISNAFLVCAYTILLIKSRVFIK